MFDSLDDAVPMDFSIIVRDSAMPPPSPNFGGKNKLKIRKDFPETFVWEDVHVNETELG